MRQGTVVRHPQYGAGVIVAIDSLRGLNVDFGYVTAWVPSGDLELPDDVEQSLEESPDTPEPPTRAGTPLPSLSTDVVAARRAVLALKLGQVLEENVHELSIGTDDIRPDLERAVVAAVQRQPQSILVEGSWGAGKTHLLTLLTRLAAKKGLATATVILDGEGVTLSEPMGLMEAILGSLRYPGEPAPAGIAGPLARLRRQDRHQVQGRVGRIAEAVFQMPSRAFEWEEVLDVLEDYFGLKLPATHANRKVSQLGYGGIYLPSMRARSVDDRADRFCELLLGWAEFCALTGAKGLAVVFDEVDVEFGIVRSYELCRRRNRLLGTLDRLPETHCPLLLAFGSAPAIYDVGNSNDAVQDLVESINGMKRIKAPRPNVEQTKELGVRLQELYARAYPTRTSSVEPHAVRRRIERFAEHHHDGTLDPTPRGFVRGTLELLDVVSDLEGNRVERE